MPFTYGGLRIAYGEIIGRIGDLRLGVRAGLGGWQALELVIGWHAELV